MAYIYPSPPGASGVDFCADYIFWSLLRIYQVQSDATQDD